MALTIYNHEAILSSSVDVRRAELSSEAVSGFLFDSAQIVEAGGEALARRTETFVLRELPGTLVSDAAAACSSSSFSRSLRLVPDHCSFSERKRERKGIGV